MPICTICGATIGGRANVCPTCKSKAGSEPTTKVLMVNIEGLKAQAFETLCKKGIGKALGPYQLAADCGDASSQRNLGIIYELGKGVGQDSEKAFKYYKKAARQGDAIAQRNLACMYFAGSGIGQDYKKAFAYFLKAANKEDALAQSFLGVMYEFGIGMEQDCKRAMEYYRAAADKGSTYAQTRLGSMYEEGKCVKQGIFLQRGGCRHYSRAGKPVRTEKCHADPCLGEQRKS